jgi:hypothetical protein
MLHAFGVTPLLSHIFSIRLGDVEHGAGFALKPDLLFRHRRRRLKRCDQMVRDSSSQCGSYGLIRDTGSVLLDMIPDPRMAANLRQTLESDVDKLADLHLWRLGPGHLGTIISVSTRQSRDAQFYRTRLARFKSLSHLTIGVLHQS